MRSREVTWGAALGGALFLVVAALPTPARAQEGCAFGDEGNEVLRQVTLAGGEVIYHVTRPHFVCEGGVRIWADSAVAYTETDLAHLIGSVRYLDPTRELRAAEARYFSRVGRLQASGALVLRDLERGTVVEHGDLVYFRRTEFRPEESTTVTTAADGVRPVATLVPDAAPDPDPPPQDPGAADPADPVRTPDAEPATYVVEGDEISFVDGTLRSRGSVRVDYDSVVAFGDTLVYREGADVRLSGRARIESRAYELSGRTIDMRTVAADTREIVAWDEAVLTGEDLRLTAPVIRVYGAGRALERLVAVPRAPDTAAVPSGDEEAARPFAVAGAFQITADSLDVLAPAEALERIFAAGRARSVSHARDSLAGVTTLPEVAAADWLEGDTIIVRFAQPEAPLAAAVPPPTSTPDGPDDVEPGRSATVERIVAIVEARSLYRLEPSATVAGGAAAPALHYVTGERITIVMQDGEVDRLEVEGRATGVHLEPLARPDASTEERPPGPGPDVPAPDLPGSGAQPVPEARARSAPGVGP